LFKLNQWNAEKTEKADKNGSENILKEFYGLSAFIGFFRFFCVPKKGFYFCLVPVLPGYD
jgi:hypothetical protein